MPSWPAGGPGKVALPDPPLVSSAVRVTFKFAERVGESRTRETRESVSLHPPSQRRKVTVHLLPVKHTRAQLQMCPLPARRGDRRTQWCPPSDGLRSGGTCWPCPSAQHTGVQTPGAAPTCPLQRRQPSWLARRAEAASFLSSSG